MNTLHCAYFYEFLTLSGIGPFIEVFKSEQFPSKKGPISGEKGKADS